MEGTENLDQENRRDEVFSKAVRAGKRTYFFDVKSTKGDDYYLTITESKRRFNNDSGKFFFEKHKLFLYKEDFGKFTEGLNEAIDKIKALKLEQGEEIVEKVASDYTDVDFDDLGDNN
ncbi:MAG: PUR family DNA/RNA-binding protein [Flavobacteriales bacterium]|nr:PUR family DNA/RNA-binding protein [Flavobacteriales bacterium]